MGQALLAQLPSLLVRTMHPGRPNLAALVLNGCERRRRHPTGDVYKRQVFDFRAAALNQALDRMSQFSAEIIRAA